MTISFRVDDTKTITGRLTSPIIFYSTHKNGSGGAVVVTFPSVGPNKYTINDALTKTPTASSVAAGDTALFHFPVKIYGTTVTVAYDTGTSITAAVIDLADTPV